MPDYLYLMRDDAPEGPADEAGWRRYITKLQDTGHFEGGSVIGGGICAQKAGNPPAISHELIGYIRIEAASLDQARELLAGNPHFEEGGTVEIRELPRTD